MTFLGATANSWLEISLFFIALLVCVKPLGNYMAKVYLGEKHFFSPAFGWLEKLIYHLCSVDPKKEMGAKEYNFSVLAFSLICFIGLFFILKFQSIFGQGIFRFNPENLPNLSTHLSFNTAVSFVTNTNWQSYGGEFTMSYFSQMVGLTVQNFLSAAVGMAVLAAFIRSFTRKNSGKIGNFWVDLVRGNIYILLPLALFFALFLVSQGVVQTMKPYINAEILESGMNPPSSVLASTRSTASPLNRGEFNSPTQKIAVGPAASQIAIKQIGTNGGGFFNANSAHPFENPTPLSNFFEMLAILLIPAALCYTFGKMVGDVRQGRSLLACMLLIFVTFLLFGIKAEYQNITKLNDLNISQTSSLTAKGGNMEGKETRFGVANSVLWATATTAASNGSVNAMHESFTPLGGMVPLIMMQFGEVIFGGVGSGLYGMLIFVIITVFIAGLMVGRTPEYLGKKIGAFEMKMVSIAILIPAMTVLLGTALAVMVEPGKSAIFAPGSHGFTEVLYAFTSAANNNGSAFAGLSANSPFYNYALGICMIVGRFSVIIPILAIAGSISAKNTVPQSEGTLPTHNLLFVLILTAIIILVGVLTYCPALVLGPIASHFNLMN